ncbi:helix-hairpin-helix domain-containing protein [Patescibacteria group bacterium]|nr:helix-hairpin-helix domain-containing protein [Patescibacteria group bacterium]
MVNLPKINYIQFNLTLLVLLISTFLVSSVFIHNKNLSARKEILIPFSTISNQETVPNVLGDSTTNSSGSPDGSKVTDPALKISINSATKEQLMAVKGIGEKYAQSILDFIKEKGSIKSINELDSVKGIGPKTIEELKKSFY